MAQRSCIFRAWLALKIKIRDKRSTPTDRKGGGGVGGTVSYLVL